MEAIFTYNTKASQSMSRKGICWDNAVPESYFKTIKYECLYRYRFNDPKQLYDCIHDYIRWYNNIRIHSAIGYKSPLEREIEIRNQYRNVA